MHAHEDHVVHAARVEEVSDFLAGVADGVALLVFAVPARPVFATRCLKCVLRAASSKDHMKRTTQNAKTGFLASLLASVLVFGAGAFAVESPEAAQADDQIVEFTDDTRIHGRILKLGTDELFLQRIGFKEPLVFSFREIRRIVLRGPLSKAERKHSVTNATMQFHGGGWIAGNLASFENGRFQMRVGMGRDVTIDREKVRWLFLSPSDSPDACEGPGSPLGLAGWHGGAWEATDAGLVARGQAAPLRRSLDLPAKLDIEFTASRDANGNSTPIMMSIGEGGENPDGENFTGGFFQVVLQRNNVSANSSNQTESANKSFQQSLKAEKDAPKSIHYRLLFDRRAGRMIVLVNGRKVADWDAQWKKNALKSCLVFMQCNSVPWPDQHMRITPWDGNIEPAAKPEEAGKDLLSSDAQGRSAGSLEAMSADTVRFDGKDFARKEPLFIRLAGKNPDGPQPRTVARLRLTQRGEIDATSLDFRDGEFRIRTSFAGEIALPQTAIRTIEFPTIRGTAEVDAVADRLVFKNGDVLRGTLLAAPAGVVEWRPARGAALEAATGTLAGIVMGRPAVSKAQPAGAVVRLRNGDWLEGNLERLDTAELCFNSAAAGPLQIARANLGALYFSTGNGTPVSDAAADRGIWTRNALGGGEPGGNQTRCRYLDGAFFPNADGQNRTDGTDFANLGRSFARLPDKVEFSFDVPVPKDGDAAFNLQLFADPVRGGGLAIDFGGNQGTIQDMTPQPGNMQLLALNVELASAGVKGNARHFRFLADRKTGQLAMFVNGKLVARYSPRAGKASPKRGRYVFLSPQAMGMTFSNLWIAPWAGSFPKMSAGTKSAEPVPPPSDVISLINGDETPGTIESTTPEKIRVRYDGGDVDLPLNRTQMIELAGPPVAPAPGTRLRLTGGGVLTVQSFTLAGGIVSCRSTLLGDVKFPVAALSEIAWQRPGQKAPAGVPAADAKPGSLPPALPLDQARFNVASLDAAPARSYDVIEIVNAQEAITGRFEMKTTVANDSITLDDALTLTMANATSLTRKTVVEKGAALRVKQIAAESVRGTMRKQQTLTVADGKATVRAAGAAKSPDQILDYPPDTVTLFSLMRIVTALPADAEGEWGIGRVFNEFRMRPQSNESYRLECTGKESIERDNRTRTLTRFTLHHERRAEEIIAEFLLDDAGVLQQVDFLGDASPRGAPLTLRLRPAE